MQRSSRPVESYSGAWIWLLGVAVRAWECERERLDVAGSLFRTVDNIEVRRWGEPRRSGTVGRLQLVEPAGLIVTLEDHELAAKCRVLGAMVPHVHVAVIDRQDFDLAGLVRHDEASATRKPRSPPVGLREYLEASHDRNLVRSVARGRSTLEQVIRWASDERKASVQGRKHLRIVVDPLDQRTLVHADHAAADEAVDASNGHIGQLAGMVEMGHEVDALLGRRVFAERRLQLVVIQDSPRIECRHFRPDANDLDMRDFPQGLKNLDEATRTHKQRIAAGEKHVGDVGIAGDVFEALRYVVGHLVVLIHEKPFAKAIAAIGPANLVAEQQDGVGIFVLHAAGDRDGLFVAGVKLSPLVELFLAWDNELLDRVVGIIPVDEPQVVVVGPEDVPLRDPLEFLTLRWRNPWNLVDIANLPNPLDRRAPARDGFDHLLQHR